MCSYQLPAGVPGVPGGWDEGWDEVWDGGWNGGCLRPGTAQLCTGF